MFYYGENHPFIKEINYELCVGILMLDKKYYSFLISEKTVYRN